MAGCGRSEKHAVPFLTTAGTALLSLMALHPTSAMGRQLHYANRFAMAVYPAPPAGSTGEVSRSAPRGKRDGHGGDGGLPGPVGGLPQPVFAASRAMQAAQRQARPRRSAGTCWSIAAVTVTLVHQQGSPMRAAATAQSLLRPHSGQRDGSVDAAVSIGSYRHRSGAGELQLRSRCARLAVTERRVGLRFTRFRPMQTSLRGPSCRVKWDGTEGGRTTPPELPAAERLVAPSARRVAGHPAGSRHRRYPSAAPASIIRRWPRLHLHRPRSRASR